MIGVTSIHAKEIDPVRIYSENEQYFLEIIADFYDSSSDFGVVNIYKEGIEKPLYTINQKFGYSSNRDLIFLSNDGISICYIKNEDEGSKEEYGSISFYKNGKHLKSYSNKELINCDNDSEECELLYRNENLVQDSLVIEKIKIRKTDTTYRKLREYSIKKYIELDNRTFFVYKDSADKIDVFCHKFPSIISNDTIFLITNTKNVLSFDIKTAKLIFKVKLLEELPQIQEKAKMRKIQKIKVEMPSRYHPPLLIDSSRIDDYFYDKLGLKEPESQADSNMFIHSFTAEGYMDTLGNFEILKLKNYSNFPDSLIKEYFSRLKFAKPNYSKNINKWFYSYHIEGRNQNDSIAKSEFDEFIKQRSMSAIENLSKDCINNNYIPIDLNDANLTLDLLLSTKIKNQIDTMQNSGEMSIFHIGLGMWLRNNWKLWGDSRLSLYFNTKGVCNADNMSGYILRSYYYYRHKIKYDNDKEISKETE